MLNDMKEYLVAYWQAAACWKLQSTYLVHTKSTYFVLYAW